MAKNNNFTTIPDSPFDMHKNLNAGYSISISKPLCILECEMGNIMTNEDCTFLKIDQKILELTRFHRIKEERNLLFEECRLHHSISK